MFSQHWRLSLVLLCASSSLGLKPAAAATEPPSAAAILQDLRSFGEMGSVLYVAAHPDDENTQFITYCSRGRGYRTAYLSLTRGEGGQNELGPDFGAKLGVLRTQELLAARRVDGGRQFFSRAIDFGFSKSPEETLRFWNRDEVLADVVRVIRQFRPDVIVTRFPIPPGSGGHGHHTASAILAVEAFKRAGDPSAFPGQLQQGLTPWQPKRIVWNAWGGPRGNSGLDGPTVKLDIGGNDPVTGEPFGTIANRSRGMHKTQGLGGFSGRDGSGPNVQSFMLLAGETMTKDLMDGIDLTWNRVAGGAEIGRLTEAAIAGFKASDLAASVPALLELHRKLAALPADPLVDDKRTQLDRIIQSCLGLEVESTVDRPEVVPGEKLHVTTVTRLDRSAGRSIAHLDHNGGYFALQPGKPDTHTIELTTPPDLPFTQPYWLREDGTAGLARVSDPTLIGRPESRPTLSLKQEFAIDGERIFVDDEPVYLTRDAQGEHRRRLDVIPPVSLAFDSEIFLVPPGTQKSVTVEVRAARADTRGTLRIDLPAGWRIAPDTRDFSLSASGEKVRLTFTVTAAAQPSSGYLTAVATVNGHEFSYQREELRYPHLPVQLLQPPARAPLASFTFATRSPAVGYLPGAGDSIAECLQQMGCTVRLLAGADLTPEKLRDLDAVVIGLRAFNERDDLAANLPGLFAYVENGGTVVAQYNRPNGLKAKTLGPYSLSIEGPAPQLRVTDEESPVSFLQPDHPALNFPNKITAADFAGWIQERGAYFPGTWDEAHYTPVLAMNDPGEAPLKGSLLVARYGKGYYVYTGLAFFRQLPAGVPGAYRLFANLLSLGK